MGGQAASLGASRSGRLGELQNAEPRKGERTHTQIAQALNKKRQQEAGVLGLSMSDDRIAVGALILGDLKR